MFMYMEHTCIDIQQGYVEQGHTCMCSAITHLSVIFCQMLDLGLKSICIGLRVPRRRPYLAKYLGPNFS